VKNKAKVGDKWGRYKNLIEEKGLKGREGRKDRKGGGGLLSHGLTIAKGQRYYRTTWGKVLLKKRGGEGGMESREGGEKKTA